MDQPIFKTALLGSKVMLFDKYLLYSVGFGEQIMLRYNNLASIHKSMWGMQSITVRTKDREKYRFIVRLRDKDELTRLLTVKMADA